MKKVFLVIVSVLFIYNVSVGQVQKGNMLLGSELQYSNTSISNDQLSLQSLLILPQIGFYMSDKTLFGLGIGYEKTEDLQQVGIDRFGSPIRTLATSDLLIINLFGRVQSNLTDKLRFNTSFDFSIGDGEVSFPSIVGFTSGFTNNITIFRFRLDPGLYYFVGNSLVLTTSFGILQYQTEASSLAIYGNDSNRGNTSIDFGFNLNNIRMGVQFLLNRKLKKDKTEAEEN